MTNILRKIALAVASMAALTSMGANVTMHTPAGFQVLAVSPNGEWACGAYIDASNNMVGFRWDLLSDDIELLGSGASVAWDVANDGTVSGDAQVNGDPRSLPAIWRDGAWHVMELPAGSVTDGIGGCITPDGHYMTGSVCVDGRYTPFIWHDGQISRNLDTGLDAVASAISPDGQAAAGFDSPNNRVNCYWPPVGDKVYFMDSPENNRGPWYYARNFSPDGSKLVYWGGWDYNADTDENYLYCVYDVATGERRKLLAEGGMHSDMEFFDISDSGLCVGYNMGRGFVHTGEQGMYIDDYLLSRGLDLSTYDDFYSDGDYYQGQLPISKVVSLSADDRVLAMDYYNGDGQLVSLVVKLDQDYSAVAPLRVDAHKLTGLNTVGLNWKRPVGANNVRGYNVYRDGQKLNGIMPINVLSYYDRGLTEGTYSYEVSAVTVAGIETKAQPVSVTVGPDPIAVPTRVMARQKGVNSALVSWRPALDSDVHKHYYDDESDLLGNFSVYADVAVEMAVRYDRAEMACYDGYCISQVNFVPMAEHNGWKVNIYTLSDAGELSLIASQPVNQDLKLRQINAVRLDQPVDVPNATLIVALECQVNSVEGLVIGNELGHASPGYSDLLRITTEPEFYSAYEASLESGMFISAYSWAIDLGLMDKYEDCDKAGYIYDVQVDGASVGMTKESRVVVPSLVDGLHEVMVSTVVDLDVPTPGRSEAVATTVNIAAKYPAVTGVTVDGAEPAAISWEAPVDDDASHITYSEARTPAVGIQGNPSNNYSMIIGAKYPVAVMQPYDGYQVRAFRYYPMAEAVYSIAVYRNGREVLYFDAPDPVLGEWNEVACPEELVIDGNSEYMLVFDIYEPTPETGVMGLDDGYAVAGCGDLYTIDYGATWPSLSDEVTLRGNWMIGLVVADADGAPLAVDGYDVVIDGRVKNDAKVTATQYQHDFGKTDGSKHSVRIDAYYPGMAQAVRGDVTYFYLQTSGIADVESTTEITLHKGANMLVAEGEGVQSMSVVAINGLEMAHAQGSQVDISHLRPGVYLVRIALEGRDAVTRKVTIR